MGPLGWNNGQGSHGDPVYPLRGYKGRADDAFGPSSPLSASFFRLLSRHRLSRPISRMTTQQLLRTVCLLFVSRPCISVTGCTLVALSVTKLCYPPYPSFRGVYNVPTPIYISPSNLTLTPGFHRPRTIALKRRCVPLTVEGIHFIPFCIERLTYYSFRFSFTARDKHLKTAHAGLMVGLVGSSLRQLILILFVTPQYVRFTIRVQTNVASPLKSSQQASNAAYHC